MDSKKIKILKMTVSALIAMLIIAAVGLVAFDMRFALYEAVKNTSLVPIELKLEEYKENNMLLGCLIVAMLQMLTIVFMMPSDFIEVLAAICLGKWSAFLSCLAGVCIGNAILFFILRKVGKNIVHFFKPEHKELIDDSSRQRLSPGRVFFGITALYFAPGIPCGVIAITAASTGIPFIWYILLTTIGCVPAISLSVLFGTIVMEGSRFWVIFTLILVLTVTVLAFIFNKQITAFFMKQRKPASFEDFRKSYGKFDRFFYSIMYFVFKVYIRLKGYKIKTNKEVLKDVSAPYIMIYNHASFMDFAWVLAPMYPRKIHSVLAAYYFYNFTYGGVLHNKVGAFPKFLFSPDISTARNIIGAIRDGEIVTMAPEGRLSPHGEMESISSATVMLLKMLKVDVILCKTHGAYLSAPKWANAQRPGEIEVEFSHLFTPEELENNDDEVLYQRLYSALDYDDFEWQKERRVKFKSTRLAEGLEKILYICPKCKGEFGLSSKGDRITCSHCGLSVRLNEYYEFESDEECVPENIRDWYNMQKRTEAERVCDPNFSMSSPVTLKMPDPRGRGFSEVGQGEARLDHSGLYYSGTVGGQEEQLFFPIETMPAMPFGAGKNFENYSGSSFYYFIPENTLSPVKWSITEEEIYKKYIKDNNIKITR